MSFGIRTQLDNPRLGIGLSINNIGGIIKNFNDIDEGIPTSLSISTFYSPKYFPGILLLDIFKYQNTNNLQVHGGIEINLGEYLLLRLGNSTNALNFSDSYFIADS